MSQPDLDLADEGAPILEEAQPTPAAQPAAPVPTQKQQTDIYTVMLIIAFVCVVIACILLYWELSLWGSFPWWDTRGAT